MKNRNIQLKCIEGELNVTFHKKYFGSNTDNPKILKGASIQRYFYTYDMSQGQIDYLDETSYLHDCGNSVKSQHHLQERIAMQGMTGANDKIRLIMSVIPSGLYLANSCNYIMPTKGIDLYCLLAVLNSRLINWFFRCFSTNSNVNGYEVDKFPIPTIGIETQKKLSLLAKEISDKATRRVNCDDIEKEININVYKLYGLDDSDVAIIEK